MGTLRQVRQVGSDAVVGPHGEGILVHQEGEAAESHRRAEGQDFRRIKNFVQVLGFMRCLFHQGTKARRRMKTCRRKTASSQLPSRGHRSRRGLGVMGSMGRSSPWNVTSKEEEQAFYVGGMRSPYKAVLDNSSLKSLGIRIRAAWETFVNKRRGLLA